MGFLQLQAGATLCCGTQASHCPGFSCCRAQVLGHMGSVVTASGTSSTGSLDVAHWLSCSVACGLFPDQGLSLCPLHWQADSYLLYHQGSPLSVLAFKFC